MKRQFDYYINSFYGMTKKLEGQRTKKRLTKEDKALIKKYEDYAKELELIEKLEKKK